MDAPYRLVMETLGAWQGCGCVGDLYNTGLIILYDNDDYDKIDIDFEMYYTGRVREFFTGRTKRKAAFLLRG